MPIPGAPRSNPPKTAPSLFRFKPPLPENRIMAVLEHIPIYSFEGPARLAIDASLARSTVCRIINAQTQPSYRCVFAIAKAISKRLKKSIDPRELITYDGTYPTESVCQLVGCKGCLPSHFYSESDEIKPEYKGVKPGEWSKRPEFLVRGEVS